MERFTPERVISYKLNSLLTYQVIKIRVESFRILKLKCCMKMRSIKIKHSQICVKVRLFCCSFFFFLK